MLIFHKAQLAYLANPKTGTTAIEAATLQHASAILRDPPGLKHTNARKFNRKFRALLEVPNSHLETIAVIRQPQDWLGSWYRYRARSFLDGKPRSTAHISFAQFISDYLSDTPPEYAKIGAQAKFLTDGAGKCLIDHLFAYDHMDALCSFLSDRLGAQITLDQLNTSPKSDAFDLSLPASLNARLTQHLDVEYRLYSAAL